MIRINCDIGERGAEHPVDLALMDLIDIANVACGGHAGDRESVRVFSQAAGAKGVALAAHLSYPDRPHFGRLAMTIGYPELLAALDDQMTLLPTCDRVKFHGALYNESVRNPELADVLADWLRQRGIAEVLAPADSKMATACREAGIGVVREAFAERRYEWDEKARCLVLVDRRLSHASITDLAEALAHSLAIAREGRVQVGHGERAGPRWHPIAADTLCIHSDSPLALSLAASLRQQLSQSCIP